MVLFEAPWKPAELTQDYTGVDPKHRNSWPAIGIPGNLEAAQAYLGSHGNTWPAIGIPGQLKEHLVTWRLPKPTWAAIGMLGNLEAAQAYLDSHRNSWPAIRIPGQL